MGSLGFDSYIILTVIVNISTSNTVTALKFVRLVIQLTIAPEHCHVSILQ